VRYDKGLLEVADRVHAYFQPDGSWGWSNAGLALGEDDSLLVDTLFDLRLTAEMLDTMAPLTADHPIRTLVNTHANGDHCFGNQLVTGAEVIASAASAAEMAELPPSRLELLLQSDLGDPTNTYIQTAFGSFSFAEIDLPRPTRTFTHRLDLERAGHRIELIEVGPAHSTGDILVHLPEPGVVFAGDILFIGGTPIVWAGPVSNWIAACDHILQLDCAVIVPGHGPLTDEHGVRAVADYLGYIEAEAQARHEAGMTAEDAARDIELGSYRDWLDWERVVINVDTVYRDLDPHHPQPDMTSLFRQMAVLKALK
jgi:glyoxylase-like metal-dependent hydrolase (beta-lactamase superfamily II)